MNYVMTRFPIISVTISVLLFLLVFPTSSLLAAEKTADLEIIAGPEMFSIESKGAMLKLFTLRNLMADRAHQLKLSFFPQIVDDGLIVKFFTVEGTPLGRPILLKAGRTALLELDSGLTDLMVMIEENGKLEDKMRVFASVLRYGAKESAALKNMAGQSAGKKSAPEKLVKEVDILEAAGSKQALDKSLKMLGISQEEGESFAVAMANSRRYVADGNFGAVNYFLKEAQRICDCGEVYLSRAFVFGPVDIDVAIENIEKAIQYFRKGRSASVILGKGNSNPEGRACVVAANIIIQKTFGRGRLLPAEEAKMKIDFDRYIARALEVDKGDAQKPVDILIKQWEIEAAKKSVAQSEISGSLEQSVKDFFHCRELFAEKKYSEALDYMKKHTQLPEADTAYLKAEILLNMGRREGAKKALEESVELFDKGRCLAGKDGGPVDGTNGEMPPASVRAALSRVSLARYWAEKFANEQGSGEKEQMSEFIQKAITLMDEAIEAIPSHREWQLLVNTYRTAKLKYLYQ
jgi:tetratricopeptide (TPR) repeat protein